LISDSELTARTMVSDIPISNSNSRSVVTSVMPFSLRERAERLFEREWRLFMLCS